MEIIGVNYATKYTPTMIKFTWNNGKKAYVGVKDGKIKFFNLVKNENGWVYEPSNYQPNENILKSVINMILKYSRSFIEEKMQEYKAKYENFKKCGERWENFTMSSRYKYLNYQSAMFQIDKLEKVWRDKNEKVC